MKGKNGEMHAKPDELDVSSLMDTEEASKKFKRAEKSAFYGVLSLVPHLHNILEHRRPRIQYTYPPSPTSSGRSSPEISNAAPPLSQRIRQLQAELAALEVEVSDPTNPALHTDEEGHIEPGDLIRDIVDAKSRLGKITKLKEGRGKLVSAVMQDEEPVPENTEEKVEPKVTEEVKTSGDVKDIAEMDKRVGELEKIIGSSNTVLDEVINPFLYS